MKLTEVYIEKFRAIRTSVISVNSELALVGQNSAGKSSILRAINAFFNFTEEKPHFESGRHAFQKTSTTVIELEFSDVPIEIELTTYGPANRLRARLKYKKSEIWQIYNGQEWLAAPQDLHEKIKKHINYAYIPLRRDHEVANWTDNSLLKKAVHAWLTNHTSRRDRISPKVADLSKIIQTRTLDGLGKHLRKATPLSGVFTFNLGYKTQPDYSIFLNDIALRVTEGDTTVDLEDCGSGTQSMAAFALYSYLAEQNQSTYILGIEEPESNLHPQAQRELINNLRKLPLQVIFTTHSTVMLDELLHEEVVLCRKKSTPNRGIEVTTTQLSKDFWSSRDIDKDGYYQFYRRRNSEFFFSNFVVITESPIDAEIIKHLLREGGADPIDYSVSIIALDGVKALPYAYWLSKELAIPFAVVVDRDYFTPYLHDELEKSRDSSGFPKYKSNYNNGILVQDILPLQQEQDDLLNNLNTNHSKAMDILESKSFFCFRWSLEVDLVAAPTAANLLYNSYNIPAQDRNPAELLIKNKKSIKKLDRILPIIKLLPPRNLPGAYKRIRRKIPELIKQSKPY